ncbi:uncharacterized protein [Palaemon carinicauda]|uniref:uncharacterized protein n=1 Tax=Palaemon carinicauda TaxID=392227 RepID=UPI0035B68691
MGFSSNAILLCVITYIVLNTLTDIICSVSAAPNLELDTTRIYFPHELEDLLRATALQNCMKDPNCNPNVPVGTIEARCSLRAGIDNVPSVSSERISLRTGSPGECNPFTGEVLWPATGECVTLLTQGPCPPEHWVKMRVPELVPVCERRPCNELQALTANRCLNTQDKSPCPAGMSLVNNEFGKGECDCDPGTAYHASTRRCYKPFSQGPCPPGHVIQVIDSERVGTAKCLPNMCPEENMVMLDNNCQVLDSNPNSKGTCYFLDTQGPCTSGILTIDEVLLEPLCFLQTETHSIFNLPNIRRCPRGSIRDSQGRCRQDVSKMFGRPPVVTSRPGTENGRICPTGQLLLGGFCYRFAPL